MTDDFASATETAEVANADPIAVPNDLVEGPTEDAITIDRKIGKTRASVTLMSGTTVSGDWAAGDSQAFRRLIGALMEIADGATARVDRAARLVDDLTIGNRILREQLREALDDIEGMHTQRKADNAEQTSRIGELMAEITTLKKNLAEARATPTMTPEQAEVAKIVAEREQLRGAFTTEKRRADAAIAAMQAMNETRLAVEETLRATLAGSEAQIQQKALDAARAADEAFEEAKWKEGSRYLKLANMWIGLLNAVVFLEAPQTEPA